MLNIDHVSIAPRRLPSTGREGTYAARDGIMVHWLASAVEAVGGLTK
jgi:hypothetical protein